VSTNDCIIALQHGEAGPLRRLYAHFSPEVLQWVTQHGGSSDDAREVFQSALVILYEQVRADAFPKNADFSALLTDLCRNIWKNRRPTNTYATAAPSAEDEEAWGEQIAQEEKNRLFRHYFRLLGAKCQMLLAFFFDGHPMEVICEQVGDSDPERVARRKDDCKQQLMLNIRKDPRYAELA
jgi:RNA polymerase sigma factor (sigma-70 family)